MAIRARYRRVGCREKHLIPGSEEDVDVYQLPQFCHTANEHQCDRLSHAVTLGGCFQIC